MNDDERMKLRMRRKREKVIGKDMVCPYCYSDDVKGIGKYFTQYKGIRQRYICKVCKKTFYLDQARKGSNEA